MLFDLSTVLGGLSFYLRLLDHAHRRSEKFNGEDHSIVLDFIDRNDSGKWFECLVNASFLDEAEG